MRFEFLVEGRADKTALSILMEKILGKYKQPHRWDIHKHRGIGKLPDNPSLPPNGKDPTLLHNLPAKLRAYGLENCQDLVVVVLVDLDDRSDCIAFKRELQGLCPNCSPLLKTLFRIAIPELESWFLGDKAALEQAYPSGDFSHYKDYQTDGPESRWEFLAKMIHKGGLKALKQHGKRSVRILEQKRKWAVEIAPLMNIEENRSASFAAFRDGLRKAANCKG